jgi:restriction system protein
MTVWVVRAGSRGEYEELAMSQGIAAVHFGLRQNVAEFNGRESLREEVMAGGEGRSAADQLWNFVHEIRNGDAVVLPRKGPRVVAVGNISGGYEYRPDTEAPHARSVDWKAVEIPRADFDQDLLYSFGGLATVYQVRANDAQPRIDGIVARHLTGTTAEDAEATVIASDNEEFRTDLEEQITERIIERIRQRFSGIRLEYLVASILRASGCRALETRPGPDGGIDVVAGQGDMGFGHPRLCVQVKSGLSPVGVADYNRLQGSIGAYGAEHGLLISLGDFTRAVRTENERSFFQIRLWGPNDLVDRLLETYSELPEDIRSEIPIKNRGILIETDG